MNKSVPAKRKAVGHEGTIVVSRTKFNQIDEERQSLEIRPFGTDPAHIVVKLGRTINLGNYESARVDVSIDIPCYVEEVKQVYSDVMEYAQGLLAEEVTKITDSINAESSVEELI